MCGIVGFYSENPRFADYRLLKKIIYESKIRGLHSFGLSYFNESGSLITKKAFNLSQLEIPKSNIIIFHNRYSTSGDWHIEENNQPIVDDYNSVVFNGVIDMGTKKEIEKNYDIQMKTENDAEIILNHADNLESFIKNTKGSCAALLLSKSKQLKAFRNASRPLWICKHLKSTYFASTKDIFIRADKKLKPELLEPYKIYNVR